MRRWIYIIAGIILSISCVSCHKEETNQLVGTSWECREDGSILLFNNNHSGVYYCKSATDDVYDEFFSSFDFAYEFTSNDISLHIYYTKRTSNIDLKKEGNLLTTKGDYHKLSFIQIQHKKPI